MVRGLDIVLGLELFFDPSPRHPVLNPAGLELIPHGPGRCFSLYPFKGLNREVKCTFRCNKRLHLRCIRANRSRRIFVRGWMQ